MCRLVWEGGGSLNGQCAMNELDPFLKRKSDPFESCCLFFSAVLVLSPSRGLLCGDGTAGCPQQCFLSDHASLGVHRDASESPESEKVLVQTLEFSSFPASMRVFSH